MLREQRKQPSNVIQPSSHYNDTFFSKNWKSNNLCIRTEYIEAHTSTKKPCLTWSVSWDKPGQIFCPHATGCHKSQRILIQICDVITKRTQQLTITDACMLWCVFSFFSFLLIIIRLIASQTVEFLYRRWNTNLHRLSKLFTKQTWYAQEIF